MSEVDATEEAGWQVPEAMNQFRVHRKRRCAAMSKLDPLYRAGTAPGSSTCRLHCGADISKDARMNDAPLQGA